MWPEIPENLENLTSTEVHALATAVAKALAAAPTRGQTAEQIAEWEEYRSVGKRLRSVAEELEIEEIRQAEATKKAKSASDADDAGDADDAPKVGTPDPIAEVPVIQPTDAKEPPVDPADQSAPKVEAPRQATLGLDIETDRQIEVPSRRGLDRWVSTGAANGGPDKGHRFGDLNELAAAVMDAASVASSGGAQKLAVAKQYANWGDRPKETYELEENPYFNLNRFEFDSPDEVTAAMCAPLTPLYDLACDNATRRPVAMGLPNFRSPERGGFTVYPSPSLSDITGGYGQWTSAMDNDPEAIKNACQTITCSTPTAYEIYGVYRCLTVKNLVNMTFPELVRAYLNRLEAAWARYAETLLLDAMGTASVAIDAPAQGFSATTSLKRAILTYLGLYQEIERWDAPVMDAWMPRWLQFALKVDAVSRRRDDGVHSAPSNEEIDGWFRDVGVVPHWYMDRPSWATPIPDLATTGALNFFPNTVEILLHRRGKFALMDRGDLTIGVSPNNIYRLGDDLRRNQFTFFFESFEGIIDTDSCPAHILQIPDLCYNGVQIADVAIACEGYDVVGIGS